MMDSSRLQISEFSEGSTDEDEQGSCDQGFHARKQVTLLKYLYVEKIPLYKIHRSDVILKKEMWLYQDSNAMIKVVFKIF
jgi:hypothetical protein